MKSKMFIEILQKSQGRHKKKHQFKEIIYLTLLLIIRISAGINSSETPDEKALLGQCTFLVPSNQRRKRT